MEKISTKLIIIMLLYFGFWIAQSFVSSLTSERARYATKTQQEIAANYVGEQSIMTPFVQVPVIAQCLISPTNEDNAKPKCREQVTRMALLYPEHSAWQPTVTVSDQRFKRGIYAAKSFETSGTISGRIAAPHISLAANERLDWSRAVWQLALSDYRGLDEMPEITVNGQKARFTLNEHDAPDNAIRLLTAPWQPNNAEATEFSIHLQFAGTQSLRMLPLGAQSNMKMHANWPHPSFFGNTLPLQKNIADKEFNAQWQSRMAGRQNSELLQHCLNTDDTENCLSWNNKSWQSMGVRFVDVSDTYSLTERSIKYGMLLIMLTFGTFFLFEVLHGLRIHPVQYALVGAALSVFYLLLLSFGEQIGFNWAYLIASIACIGLIVWYLRYALHNSKRAFSLGAMLATVYGVLYWLLHTDEHTLLIGSVMLFAAIAAAMFFTRHVNWYTLNDKIQR